jgi:hypothetical protein
MWVTPVSSREVNMLLFHRKIVAVFVTSLITFSLIPMTATSSQAVTVGDLEYSIAGKTATVIGCKDNECPNPLTIPATVPGTSIAVTSIGERAFVGFPNPYVFSAVSLPASLTSIQEAAFQAVTVTSRLLLPTKLTRIEKRAFADSTLASITFNNSLNHIGEMAFSGASINTDSKLSMQTGEIQGAAFEGISFTEVSLGPNFSFVGSYAFAKEFLSSETPEINNLSIAGGDIGSGAFAETKIDTITLGSKIGSIASGAFAGPNFDPPIERGDLTVNSGIIQEGAFRNSTFERVTIGKSVLAVGSGAFGSFSSPYPSLGNVSIDARVLSQGAFSGATMSSLSIGTNVASIGGGAFGGGSDGPFALGEVSIKGGAFSPGSFTSVTATKTTIEATVKKVGVNAFFTSTLGALSVNSSQIAEFAFSGSQASSLKFGTNLKSIGNNAFNQFQVTGENKAISLNAEFIDSFAFYQSNITNLTLGSKVKTIEKNAFADAPFLEDVVVNSGQIKSFAFYESGVENLVIGAGVTRIDSFAFADTAIASLDIANGLSSIGEGAFYSSAGTLAAIRIPNSVVSIGENAFGSRPELRSVSLGTGLRYLEDGAFGLNVQLSDIEFYGPPPTGSLAFPNQIMNVHHTNAHNTAWMAAFNANPDWSVPPISRVSGLPQSTLTFTSVSNDKPTATKITVKANYSMITTGKVKVTVTKSGSKTVLCTKTVSTRNLSGVTGVITCDLSKKVRDELKKKALTLSVSTTFTPDLGDSKTSTKSLTMRKQ